MVRVVMSLTLVVFAQILAAAPTVSSAQFKCESKSNVQAPWDDRGAVSIQSDNAAVQLNFIPGGSSQLDGMGFMSTTNQDSEFRVEARCPGQFIVKSASPIRIRDFVFQVRDADIGSPEGFIELNVSGFTSLLGQESPSDEFGKQWTVHKNELERFQNEPEGANKNNLDPFKAKQEQKTLCGTNLLLRFNDLRAVAQRNRTSDNNERRSTSYQLNHLRISFEACQP